MKRATITLAATLIAAGTAFADTAPGDVVFDDGAVAMSLTGVAGDAASGPAVIGKKGGNCIACHQITILSDLPFQGEIGPSLDGVAGRWTEPELRGIVADAKVTFEDSMMPSFYKTTGFIRPGKAYTGKAADGPLAPLLTAQQIEDVVAFLLTLTE